MKKMKKLLALMCIAIAALIWLPGLKFPVEAGSVDYEETVLVESGADVTLSINLSKLNLPAGFEVGSCNWLTDGGAVSADGLSYTLRNVTKSQFVYVSISDKNSRDGKFCEFYIYVNSSNITAKAVGNNTVIANSGEKVTLKVSASSNQGKLTYTWYKGQSYGGDVGQLGHRASYTCTAPVNKTKKLKTEDYHCVISDEMGNSSTVSFTVYVNSIAKESKLKTNKVYILTWDSQVEQAIKAVNKKYPSYTKNIEVIKYEVGGGSAEYYALVQQKLANNPEATFIVLMDSAKLDVLLSTGVFTDLDKLGLTDAYSQSYPYTRKAGTYKGKLVAMTPEATPGAFMFDPDIAQKVLGTSDPEKVQKMIGTADGYLSVAAKMKEAGYYMTSGASKYTMSGCEGILNNMIGDTSYSYEDNSKVFMLSEADKKTVEKIAKATRRNGYDTGSSMWSSAWVADMTSGKVFGWFSGTWGQYSITFDKPMAACQGPFAYNWGGTYYAIKSGRQDEAAVQFLKALCCDPSVMSSLGDLPNNTVAAQKVISKGKNPAAMKNNQNIYKVFDKMARSINGGSYKISKPKVSLTSNGIVKGSDGKYYYVKKGLIQSGRSGFIKVGKKTYYIKKGVVQNKKTGFVKKGKKYYYVKKGVCSTKNEFVKVGKKTYYLNKGAKNTKTGFVKVGKATYYVKKGLKTDKTAFIKNGKKECYVKNGVWKKSYTGNVTYRKHVYYVKKGVKVKKVR
ncbi:ABC transporter substrate-binding protein [Clostridium sp. L2-50]|uniref:ABC transporter substrate-binding protein n=1 Tax=Clostridium sp. L2-50 TaxID=411489 RepID=UPI00031EFC2E|nr:ABC transporter substrate-binding protein [Clostridium sp. L2-50]UEA74473.1 ABC transporter substrate-binding protein [Lachnospiraceae bacterium GAM79]UEA77670.1 ABC transporter substrate-binding protein [Lachnospiraceae bacterium GAM79]